MAFDEGFNFRSTLAYVTDPSDTQFVNHTKTYSTTSGGVTFGWEYSYFVTIRDRDAGVDARLAGHNRVDVNVVHPFRVDLPSAGDYEITLAMGDQGYPSGPMYYRIVDDTSVLYTSPGYASDTGPSTGAGGRFFDAADTLHTSAANWVSNQVPVTYTFASTIFRLEIGKAGTVGSTGLCHLRIRSVTPPTAINANSVSMALTTYPATIVAPGAPVTQQQDLGAGSGRYEPPVDEERAVLSIIREFLEKIA